jgi:hypothetical protein
LKQDAYVFLSPLAVVAPPLHIFDLLLHASFWTELVNRPLLWSDLVIAVLLVRFDFSAASVLSGCDHHVDHSRLHGTTSASHSERGGNSKARFRS